MNIIIYNTSTKKCRRHNLSSPTMLVTLLFLVVTFVHAEYAETVEEGWQWHWECDYRLEQCHRVSSQSPAYLESFWYDSLPTCRLVCGQFGALWPKPTTLTTLERHLIPFHPDEVSFDIQNVDEEANNFLVENTKIFTKKIKDACGHTCNKVPNSKIIIEIYVESSDLTLNWYTNESYYLEVSTVGQHVSVYISAQNVFGARHGLETLTQLIASYPIFPKSSHNTLFGLVIVSGARIRDKPIFRHRGLLLDTSRNYLPPKIIKKQIDGMSSVKLNVLHWHATDSHSFPFVSRRVPQMSRYGSYSEDMVYTPTDVKDLLDYAKLRGVRVVLEIDTPSHSGFGWQWGPQNNLGNLTVCFDQKPWRSFCIQPPCGQLNPANPNVYKVLGSIYQDIVEAFPQGEVFHMGGDEVFINCWNSTIEITKYLKKLGRGVSLNDFLYLWGKFHSLALHEFDKVVGNEETPIIIWSSGLTSPEIIEEFLPNTRYVVQTWVPSSDKLPEKLLEKGYRLIISTKDAWYLDHGFWGSTQYHTWRSVYMNRIPVSKNVLGGEVCMWGEYVDEQALDSKVWPRAAAAAERLWSDPSTDTSKAESRLYAHRERLVSRGFKPEVLGPRWCYQNEGLCN